MNVEYKYAKMMYDYILETLLEQEQYELYTYALTVLHTGLRPSDVLDLTWEQLEEDRFRGVKFHKYDFEQDVIIRDSIGYAKRLSVVNHENTGRMFSKNKLVVSQSFKVYVGSMVQLHDLRMLWSRLMVGKMYENE